MPADLVFDPEYDKSTGKLWRCFALTAAALEGAGGCGQCSLISHTFAYFHEAMSETETEFTGPSRVVLLPLFELIALGLVPMV